LPYAVFWQKQEWNHDGVQGLSILLSPEQHRRVVLAAEKAGKGVDVWVAETLALAT
jgi:predicted HicB family RNase H-like nuclease